MCEVLIFFWLSGRACVSLLEATHIHSHMVLHLQTSNGQVSRVPLRPLIYLFCHYQRKLSASNDLTFWGQVHLDYLNILRSIDFGLQLHLKNPFQKGLDLCSID